MADCGATGSALDRAAASIIGAATSASGAPSSQHAATLQASKAVASIIGTTASTGNTTAMGGVMPAAPPEQLMIGGGINRSGVSHPLARMPPQALSSGLAQERHTAAMDEAWQNSISVTGGPRHAPPTMKSYPPGMTAMHPHHQNPREMMMHHQHHHHQQQQMQMQMMQQQQMHMQQMHMMQMQQVQMMQQQQQRNMQRKMKQQQQKQNENLDTKISSKATTKETSAVFTEEVAAKDAVATQTSTGDVTEEAASAWHDGLEDDFQSRLNEYRAGEVEEEDVVTTTEDVEDGYVEGASIEELAKAWAEAEAEYSADMASMYHDQLDIPEIAPYNFSEESRTYMMNPTTTTTTTTNAGETTSTATSNNTDLDLFGEGMRHFEAGEIQPAILSFESHLQNIDPDHAEAWRMLGKCHAENDEDRKAIACLERAVERDPYSPESLLALGVSYVNELDHKRALDNLKAWITHNPKFAGMDVSAGEIDDLYGSAEEVSGEQSEFDEVQRLLLRALDYDLADEGSATDVREALGVVYNVSQDYNAAVESFRAAIASRPDDYQLWNKLGATLANSSKSADALPAYHEALKLKPRYARAWLNMAISHSNLQNYDEAARCYLQTLSLNPNAGHCWSYLRIALTCSERWDLLPLAAKRDLDAFKEHFDFVQY